MGFSARFQSQERRDKTTMQNIKKTKGDIITPS